MVLAGVQEPYLVKARGLYPGATLAGIWLGSGATAAGGRPLWQKSDHLADLTMAALF